MQEANISSLVQQYLAAHSLSQAELAKLASVSQATVSRAIREPAHGHGSARSRLFTFMQREIQIGTPPLAGTDRVVGAFAKIWDGSEEHAAAVARIIEACEGLRPGPPRQVSANDR